MRRPTHTIRILIGVAAGGLGCSNRTLMAVDPCSLGSTVLDGATCLSSGDGMSPDRPDATTLRMGLVGLWHFDETPGAVVAGDSSGNGNDGILVQLDPASAWVTNGHAGNALSVGGVGYVQVAASPSIESIVTGVTMSAWVYLDGTVMDYGTALSRQLGTAIDQYYHLALWQTEGEPSLWINQSTDTAATHAFLSAATSPKSWTHLAGTYDGKAATLYVGGIQVASLPTKGSFAMDTTTPLILGGNTNGTTVSERFPGRIDEIALYNRALDASEIQRLANGASF